MARGGNESARARGLQSRTATGFAGMDPSIERQVTQLVDRIMRQRDSDMSATVEKLQVLLGERGDTRMDSALRRGELLLNIKPLPTVTAAPTADEHNQLVRAFNELVVKLADLGRKQ